MDKFKKGDRVKSKFPVGDLNVSNAIGTVISASQRRFYNIVSVEFDDYIDGHCNGGTGKEGHCWDLYPNELERIEDKE